MAKTLEELFDKQDLDFIFNQSQQITVPEKQTVFRQGDSCANYLMVLQGSVKVFSRAENGREVILYRVQDGESCTLTTACLFGDNLYPAEGVTETEVTAVMIPRPVFDQGLAQSEKFRKIVFDHYAKRLSEVITLVEDLSFGHISIRLARLLIKLTATSDTIKLTHQELAVELGTAREVISRQLKEMEKLEAIIQQRGKITVTQREQLQLIAQK